MGQVKDKKEIGISNLCKLDGKELMADSKRRFMPHGGRSRFPGSRDWDLECHVFLCAKNSCEANYMKDYEGRCVMPSLIKIDRHGKCVGFHPRFKFKICSDIKKDENK